MLSKPNNSNSANKYVTETQWTLESPQDVENFLSNTKLYPPQPSCKLSFHYKPSDEQWDKILEKVFRYLSNDGTLQLELCQGVDNAVLLKTELKLCGFKDIVVEDSSVEKKTVWTARKPNCDFGVSMDIGNSTTASTHSGGNTRTNNETVQLWTQLSQMEQDDLVDESTLVEWNDAKENGVEKSASACGAEGKGRKPCANCTCGKAEKQSTVKFSKTAMSLTESVAPSSSACGNCYRGDAFRCAGCPYLGLPPFKPGEKVDFSAQLQQADI